MRFMVMHKVDAKMEAGQPPDPQIAGFCVLELPSLQVAVAWADEYASTLVDSEVDVRPLTGEPA
jgi:hypothetical protein